MIFANGFPPIFMLLLRWISTNFYATIEMDIHQFLCYYWDGYPPIFMLLLRWISTNFYATIEMDIHHFFCYYWDGFPPIFMLVLWSRVRFISKCFGPYLWLSWIYGFKSKKPGTQYYYRTIWIQISQFWHFSICN